MIILGVETSCDETGVALVEATGRQPSGKKVPKRLRFRVLKNLIASQVKIHAPYGGVVPNLAKREHSKNLPILLKKTLGAGPRVINSVDIIAVTVGPGLEPCLWEGINFARDLAKKHKKQIVAVNHMEGHIVSALLTPMKNTEKKEITFPALALLVSGGHTELVLVKNWLDYKIIGETLDDAVGEAFDKTARLLGLPYPGGNQIERLAQSFRNKTKQTGKIYLPRPMINSKDLNFSFSGLKTAVLYAIRDNPKLDKASLAKEFQNAAVEVLVSKTLRAIEKHDPKTIIVAGGVAANKHLQKKIFSAVKKFQEIKLLIPNQQFTGDNAAMIASAGYFHALKNDFAKSEKLKASGRLSLGGKKS